MTSRFQKPRLWEAKECSGRMVNPSLTGLWKGCPSTDRWREAGPLGQVAACAACSSPLFGKALSRMAEMNQDKRRGLHGSFGLLCCCAHRVRANNLRTATDLAVGN